MTAEAATATRSFAAELILPAAQLSLRYAEQLVTTIPADKFAAMPLNTPGSELNSAAFNIGHLSIYGDRLCTMLGRTDLVKPMPYSVDLFKNGAPCLGTPGAYPGKDLLVSTFFERQRLAIEALLSADDAVLRAVNPAEGRFREMFPTVGSAVAFLLDGHVQMHLGQISAWRRVMGLGSAS